MNEMEPIPTENTPIVNKPPEDPIDWDSYTTSKSFAQSNLNLTAIGAQISLLLEVFNRNLLTGYQIGLIVLVSISLSFQLFIFAMVATLAAAKGNTIGRWKLHCHIVAANSMITFLTGCVLVLALAISGISVYAKLVIPPVLVSLVNATG